MKSRLGIVAGGGDLPRRLAEHARASGRPVSIVGLAGFADPALVSEFAGSVASIGETGRQIELLKQAGCAEVVFAGLVQRPDFKSIKLDMKGVALLPRVLSAAARGDDALLRVVVGAYESAGFKVVGADDVLSDLLAPAGGLGVVAPSETDWADIRRAAFVAAEIGKMEIGQGAVVCDGLVLAVEAQEGTDAMLERCATLPEPLRGTPDRRRGVLVKRPKPIQERRIDLPTIGAATVRRAAAAGLAGIAIEAGSALVIDREEITGLADGLGVFIYGFTPEELA